MSIRAVIFDCFGVLYVDGGTHFYEKNIAHFHELREQISDIDKQVDYGYISREEHDRQVANVTGLDYDFIHDNILQGHVRNEELLSFSRTLRNDKKIGLLSNISRYSIESFFPQQDQPTYFDAVVLSSDVGLIKPHPEIFKLAAVRLGCQPEECVMIDDVEENCAGADAAGMQAIHHTTNRQTMAELRTILDIVHA